PYTTLFRSCRSFEAPVISGNVSLFNQSGSEAILPTPVVGAVGVLDDVTLHTGLAFRDGRSVYLLGSQDATLGGGEYLARVHGRMAGAPPPLDLQLEWSVQEATRRAIRQRLICAAHDCSEGGLAVTLAESCISGGVGGRFDLNVLLERSAGRRDQTLFGEAASRVVVQCEVGREHE